MAREVALVTGSEGFVGRILCARLAEAGIRVLGCDLSVPPDDSTRRACDIADPQAVSDMLSWAGRCDYIFHLAAAASVASGLQSPGRFMRANIEGTVNLCEGMHEHRPEARLVFIGSSEVYGPPTYLPVDESHPLNPVNPYAISKLAAEHYCRYMHAAHGMNVVMLRPFNHSGPGQKEHFVLSSFARQIVEIERGLREPVLRVGNLSAKRDFSHVRDVVRAYMLAAKADLRGEICNICSGQSVAVSDALEKLRERTDVDFRVEKDPDRYRPVDVPEIRGSYDRFANHTGWAPELTFDCIMEELLAYWRANILD